MDRYIKRLQTRANRKGISVTKSQVREIYQSVVAEPESPSEQEMSAVIQKLEEQFQAPSYEENEGDKVNLELAKPQITEITPESHPDVWETLQPPTEQPASVHQEEPNQMTLAQPTTSSLTTSNHSALSKPSEGNLAVTQQDIQEAVEKQFGEQSIQTKMAIINFVCKDTFNTAQELQHALAKLRQTKLDILLKVVNDYNEAASSDEKSLKTALLQASEQRQKETEDFFGNFETQLQQMRASFGI